MNRRPDISAHRLSLFEQCPKAHGYAYIEGIPRPSATSSALLRAFAKGKTFHAAIEDAAVARRRDAGLPSVPALEELLAYVDARAIRNRLSPEDHDDVRRGATDGLPVLDLGGQLVDPEFGWVREFAPGIFGEGRYDFVCERDGRVVSRDWKCGEGEPPTAADAAYLPQVGLYLIDLHARWPDASGWEVELVYVRRRASVRVAWTKTLDSLWRGRAAAAVRAWRRGYAPAVVDDHCARCDFRDRCQSYLGLTNETHEGDAADLGDEALMAERKKAATLAAVYKDRKIECDKELRKRMRHTQDRLAAGCYKAAVRQKKREEVAAEAVVELAAHRGEDVAGVMSRVVTVSSRKLAKTLRSPLERELVRRWTTEKKSSHVEVRKA